MKVGKPKSKRVPVRLRNKIEKASAAKQRKQKKEAKNNPEWRSRLKKDPGIPNLFPYKDKILQEIEDRRQQKEEDIERRRVEAKARKSAKAGTTDVSVDANQPVDINEEDVDVNDDAMEDVDSNPMAALLASAKARAAEYDNEVSEDEMDEDDDEENGVSHTRSVKDGSRKAFDKIFKDVVDSADVILYVLDARDPDGTRSKEVERSIMAADEGSKRLILILNKIDLVPAPVLKGWLTHLRRYFPALPLRASNPAPNARTFDHKQLTVKGTSEALFKALKSFAQAKQLKRSISVGVIGYPNVGKSSVINTLTTRIGHRNAACPTGAEAGVTTSLREVKMDSKLKLLDSPGIVFPSSTSSAATKAQKVDEQARLILLNAIPPKAIDDAIPAVSLLLKRFSSSPDLMANLLSVYQLPELMSFGGDVINDFLVQVARRRGRLGKGGVPNLQAAAQTVIADWRDGRIQGWAVAPVLKVQTSAEAPNTNDGSGEGDRKEIVKEWAQEFKLEGLWGDDSAPADTEMDTQAA